MELSLMNAGRGAGKTYNLVQWASEAPNRYVVGTTHTRDAMICKNLKKQFVYLNDAKNGAFAGKRNIEVAFDNFEYSIFDFLQGDCRIDGTNSVILATNIEVWEGAPKKAEIPLSGPYAEALKKRYGVGFALLEEVIQKGADAIFPENVRASNGFPEAPWQDKVWEHKEEAEKKEEEVVPDTKKVRMDELRLDDVVVGKGRVAVLRFDSANKTHVTATVTSAGFDGKLYHRRETLVEIENK